MEKETISFESIQEKILDKSIISFIIVGCFGLVISLWRILVTGFLPLHLYQLLLFTMIILLYLCKHKLSFKFKTIVMVSSYGALGLIGISNLGVTSPGVGFLTCSVIYTLLFLSKRAYYVLMFILTSVLIAIFYLFKEEYLKLSFDIVAYTNSDQSWIMLIFSFILLTVIVQFLLFGLMENVKIALNVLSKKNEEISDLNKNLELKIQERTGELTKSNIAKDHILGVVAHDMRNKLGGITSYLDMLNTQYETFTEEERKRMLKQIQLYGDDTVVIVHDLLEYSKVGIEYDEKHMKVINICNFITKCTELYTHKLEDKGISLEKKCMGKELFSLIDPSRFSRVIDNLLSNAIKFTNSGGSICIDAIFDEDLSNVIVSIKDTGIGIPEKLQVGIFAPFTKSGREGTDNEKSTGLGLSIVKKIVEQHNGEIWFESEEGVGTTFYVSLPLL